MLIWISFVPFIMGLSRDGIAGLCQLDLFRDALGVGMAAQQFGGRLFSQGANMSGLLMVPGHFSEEKIRNTMSAWDTMQNGLNKAHKVALLQDGVKFQQLSIDPDKAQFLGTREFEVRQTVSNITGVPPHMLGDSTRTSHNSLESESQSYLSRCLSPWLRRWETELRAKLLTDKERFKDTHLFEFNRESEVQMEFEKKVNGIYRQIESSLLTPNEGRRLLNQPSAGPDGDRFYRPANWMVVGDDDAAEDATEDSAEPMKKDVSPAETALRSMITTSISKDLKIERDRVTKRAAIEPTTFTKAIEDFYVTWTAQTGDGLTSQAARSAIKKHAETSMKALKDVESVSTTESLKANVRDVVASWDARAEMLIESLMKAVR